MTAGKDRSVGSRTRPRQTRGNLTRLVRRELQRTWPSYLTSGLLNLLFGFIVVGFVWEIVADQTRGVPFGADFLFVLILANLSTNWTSTSYMQVRRDPFQEHLAFLRTLPVSAVEVISSRAALMVLSTAVMSCIFFAPLYVLPRVLGTEVLQWEFFEYLGFVGVWAGYALFCAGILLYLELGVRGGGWTFWSLIAWGVVLIAAVLVCNLVLDVRLVAGSLGLVEEYGVLPALASLAAGAAGLGLFAAATTSRVRKGGV